MRGHVVRIFLVCTATFGAVVTRPAWAEVHDLGGLRSALADRGLQLTVSYYGEALGNAAGGAGQGVIYEGRLGLIVDADLDKLIGWSGASFHASAHVIHGLGLSGAYIQNLMTVSSIEAPATTRLFNLWIEQALGTRTTLRVGQFTAAQEFLVSQFANLFVNSTFGWPVITAVDLPSWSGSKRSAPTPTTSATRSWSPPAATSRISPTRAYRLPASPRRRTFREPLRRVRVARPESMLTPGRSERRRAEVRAYMHEITQ